MDQDEEWLAWAMAREKEISRRRKKRPNIKKITESTVGKDLTDVVKGTAEFAKKSLGTLSGRRKKPPTKKATGLSATEKTKVGSRAKTGTGFGKDKKFKGTVIPEPKTKTAALLAKEKAKKVLRDMKKDERDTRRAANYALERLNRKLSK